MEKWCRIHAPYIPPNCAYFSAYFASKIFAYFKKILRYKPASLIMCLPLRNPKSAEQNAAFTERVWQMAVQSNSVKTPALLQLILKRGHVAKHGDDDDARQSVIISIRIAFSSLRYGSKSSLKCSQWAEKVGHYSRPFKVIQGRSFGTNRKRN